MTFHPLPVSLSPSLTLSLSLYLSLSLRFSILIVAAAPPPDPEDTRRRPPAVGPTAAAAPPPEDASAIKGLSDADSTAGAVPPPRPDAPFDELDATIDERRVRALPCVDDFLFDFERRDAFDLAALGQAGGASPPLYGRAKSLKSLDFDGVSRGQTFASHMTRDAGREGRGLRKAGPHHGGVDAGVVAYSPGSDAGARGAGKIGLTS